MIGIHDAWTADHAQLPVTVLGRRNERLHPWITVILDEATRLIVAHTVTDSAPAEVRARLAVALDVDDAVAALRLGRELSPWIGVAKVGLELYVAAGPDIVGGLLDLGLDVFCDLKLHDIPTTVGKAARVLGALGASYVTMHAFGGVPIDHVEVVEVRAHPPPPSRRCCSGGRRS